MTELMHHYNLLRKLERQVGVRQLLVGVAWERENTDVLDQNLYLRALKLNFLRHWSNQDEFAVSSLVYLRLHMVAENIYTCSM